MAEDVEFIVGGTDLGVTMSMIEGDDVVYITMTHEAAAALGWSLVEASVTDNNEEAQTSE